MEIPGGRSVPFDKGKIERGSSMYNFGKKKNQKLMAAIVIIVVAAMLITTVLAAFM